MMEEKLGFGLELSAGIPIVDNAIAAPTSLPAICFLKPAFRILEVGNFSNFCFGSGITTSGSFVRLESPCASGIFLVLPTIYHIVYSMHNVYPLKILPLLHLNDIYY